MSLACWSIGGRCRTMTKYPGMSALPAYLPTCGLKRFFIFRKKRKQVSFWLLKKNWSLRKTQSSPCEISAANFHRPCLNVLLALHFTILNDSTSIIPLWITILKKFCKYLLWYFKASPYTSSFWPYCILLYRYLPSFPFMGPPKSRLTAKDIPTLTTLFKSEDLL